MLRLLKAEVVAEPDSQQDSAATEGEVLQEVPVGGLVGVYEAVGWVQERRSGGRHHPPGQLDVLCIFPLERVVDNVVRVQLVA